MCESETIRSIVIFIQYYVDRKQNFLCIIIHDNQLMVDEQGPSP